MMLSAKNNSGYICREYNSAKALMNFLPDFQQQLETEKYDIVNALISMNSFKPRNNLTFLKAGILFFGPIA